MRSRGATDRFGHRLRSLLIRFRSILPPWPPLIGFEGYDADPVASAPDRAGRPDDKPADLILFDPHWPDR